MILEDWLGLFKQFSAYGVCFAAALLLSLVLTRFCISWLPKFGLMDMPGEARRIHTRPTPRGGGIAIIGSFFLLGAAVCGYLDSEPAWLLLFSLAIPSFIILCTGLIDDRFGMPSKVKLLMQIIAGIAIWWLGGRIQQIFSFTLPDYVSLPLTVLWVVTIINAFNLIDGMDGLASGLAVMASGCLLLWGAISHYPAHVLVFLTLMLGCCLGFLRYNYSPARIFLGDTGSMFLGLFFAFIGLFAVSGRATLTSLLVPLLAVGLPLFDVFLAFWRRSVRKLLSSGATGIMTADRDHLHHRLLAYFKDQRKTVLFLYLISAVIVSAGMISLAFYSVTPLLGYIILLLVVFYTVRRLAVIEIYDSAELLITNMKRINNTLLMQIAMPLMDIMLICFAYLLTSLLFRAPPVLNDLIWYMFPVELSLFVCGMYRIFWMRVAINDFRLMTEALLVGLLLAFYLHCALIGKNFGGDLARMLSFCMLTYIMLQGSRSVIWYCSCHFMQHLRIRNSAGQNIPRVLVMGGGLNCRLFINIFYATSKPELYRIIGLVDDNPHFRNMNLYGLNVLGGLGDLEQIYRDQPFERLVITPEQIDEPTRERLQAFARKYNVDVRHFKISQNPL